MASRDPFDDDPFASGGSDPLANGAGAVAQASRPAVDDFAFAEAFGSADNNASLMFDDGFGGTSASVAAATQRATKQVKADFVSPDFAVFEDGEEQSPDDAFAFEEEAESNGPTGNGHNLDATVVIKDHVTAVAPASAPSSSPLPEFGSPSFDAAPPAIQLQVAIQSGLLPPHTTLQEYLSLRGESGEARPVSPVKAPAGPAGSSFMDDFVGGTGSFDADRQGEEGGQEGRRRSSLHLRQDTEADADAAAVRIQAAIRGRQSRKATHDAQPALAPPVPSQVEDELHFTSGDKTADTAFESFDAPTGSAQSDEFSLSPETRQGSGPVSAPTTHAGEGEDWGFEAPPTQAVGQTPNKVAAASTSSVSSAPTTHPKAAASPVDDFDLPPSSSTGAGADFGFDSPPAPQRTTATPAKSSGTATPAAATLSRSLSNAVVTQASGESFEDFGFGAGTPAKPEAKEEAPVPLPPVMASPAIRGSSSPKTAVPVLTALTADDVLSRGPLPTPQPPQLQQAALGSLTFAWQQVPGADGYYLDVQSEDSGRGSASRAVSNGSCLLLSPSGSVHGLMKDSSYVARVIAVRVVQVAVQGGKAMTVMEESEPSAWSSPVRTLNPAAEIIRLTNTNRALQAQVDTLPALHAQMDAQAQELLGTQARLEAAKGEIVRLTTALNSKIAELNAAQREIASLQGAVADRDASLAAETSEVLRLGGELADCQADLAQARAKIEDLGRDIQDRDASLGAGESREKDLNARLQVKEESLKTLQSKCEALEGQLKAEKQAEAELATKLNSTADKLAHLGMDKDEIIAKLSSDIGTIMEELSRTQKELMGVQDHVAYIQPAADLVLDIRRKQAAWDAEHASIDAGTHATGGTPLGKIAARRKLGPRPSLIL